MSAPVITLLPCKTAYRHARGNWSDTYPIERLEGWIAFYRRMAAKRPENYGPDLRALLMFQKTEAPKAVAKSAQETPDNWHSIGGLAQKIIEGHSK